MHSFIRSLFGSIFGKTFSSLYKAAEQGDANAQCDLGFMFEMGQGVPQDNTTTV